MSAIKNSFKELEPSLSDAQMEGVFRAAKEIEERVNQIDQDLKVLKLIRDEKERESENLSEKISLIESSIFFGVPGPEDDNDGAFYLGKGSTNMSSEERYSSDEICNELELLKHELFERIGNDEIDEVFSIIKNDLKKDSSLIIEINLLKYQYSRVAKLVSNSLINYQEYFLESNKIVKSLVRFIVDLDNSELVLLESNNYS